MRPGLELPRLDIANDGSGRQFGYTVHIQLGVDSSLIMAIRTDDKFQRFIDYRVSAAVSDATAIPEIARLAEMLIGRSA